jgi:hypothetical protein
VDGPTEESYLSREYRRTFVALYRETPAFELFELTQREKLDEIATMRKELEDARDTQEED